METILKSGYVCHPQQLYTLRRVRVSEGKAKGTEIIEVSTAGGLQVDILPDAGLDIGNTLIGMHLKKVAVPLRLEHNRIGEAMVLAARTRPKFIGGARAIYDEELL